MAGSTTSFIVNGVGAMGLGLAHQIAATPNTRLVGLCDLQLGRAVSCCEWLGLRHQVVTSASEADAAIAAGDVAVTTNGMALAAAELGEVYFEASSAIGDSARLVLEAVEHGKHPIMMNAESDLAFGPLLAARAREAGLLYASTDGDQYGVLKKLADEVVSWGFDLVMYGNIKGFLDQRATPASIIAEADKRNLDYKMCAAYTDGTKLNIEMALIANVHGGRPAVPGMLGPKAAQVGDTLKLFDFDRIWDGGEPLIDYILGAEPGGGVFVIGHSDDPYRREMMRYYKMGEGPYYVFYRPYHLCHFEAVPTALENLRTGVPLMQATRPAADAVAYAKHPLKAGTELDGIGGFACYGLVEAQPLEGGLPICLADRATLIRDLDQDERLTLADVTFADSYEIDLYREAQAIAWAGMKRPAAAATA